MLISAAVKRVSPPAPRSYPSRFSADTELSSLLDTAGALQLLNCNEILHHTGQNGYRLRNLLTVNAGKGVEEREPFCTVGRNVNWFTAMMKSSMQVPYKS